MGDWNRDRFEHELEKARQQRDSWKAHADRLFDEKRALLTAIEELHTLADPNWMDE